MASYLNAKELCEKLKISETTLYRLLNKGMPVWKVNASNRFALEEVVEWLKKQQEEKEWNWLKWRSMTKESFFGCN